MAHQQTPLTIRPGRWSAATAALLAPALGTATMSDLQLQTEQGARLFEVVASGEQVAAFLLRVDQFDGRNEGVIVAAGGALGGVDLTDAILPHIEEMFFGCDTIRMHTARAGLAKKVCARHGYRCAEIVLTKEILHGK